MHDLYHVSSCKHASFLGYQSPYTDCGQGNALDPLQWQEDGGVVQGGKVLLLAESTAFFTVYRTITSPGMRAYQLDRDGGHGTGTLPGEVKAHSLSYACTLHCYPAGTCGNSLVRAPHLCTFCTVPDLCRNAKICLRGSGELSQIHFLVAGNTANDGQWLIVCDASASIYIYIHFTIRSSRYVKVMPCLQGADGHLREVVEAALQHADCILATEEHILAPGFPLSSFCCLVRYVHAYSSDSPQLQAVLQHAPCAR